MHSFNNRNSKTNKRKKNNILEIDNDLLRSKYTTNAAGAAERATEDLPLNDEQRQRLCARASPQERERQKVRQSKKRRKEGRWREITHFTHIHTTSHRGNAHFIRCTHNGILGNYTGDNACQDTLHNVLTS